MANYKFATTGGSTEPEIELAENGAGDQTSWTLRGTSHGKWWADTQPIRIDARRMELEAFVRMRETSELHHH